MTKLLRIFAVLLFATAVALPMWMPETVESQTQALTTDMDAKTDDLFNGFGARGTPVDERVAEPEPPQNGRGSGICRLHGGNARSWSSESNSGGCRSRRLAL